MYGVLQEVFGVAFSVPHYLFDSTIGYIKTWDFGRGVIKRIFKDIGVGFITTMAMDVTERRIFVGFHSGVIVYTIHLKRGTVLWISSRASRLRRYEISPKRSATWVIVQNIIF